MDQQTISTRDLYLASVLVTLRFKLTNVSYQTEGSKNQMVGYFEFLKTAELEKVMQEYWQGSLAVEPKEFVNNMRGLKAIVTNAYKNPIEQVVTTNKPNTYPQQKT